ncbi:DUF3348 family protein [Comamonadaceae bacterium G21597-S1]|nr:DUF3348 family protein [Comamonadaceae bacterium G21597-S1]
MAQRQFSPQPPHFSSSPLVRQLASLDIAPAGESTQTFAERLSHWVAWTDAIALSQVLADGPGAAHPAVTPSSAAAPRQLRAQCARVRKDLADAIAGDALLRDAADPPRTVATGAAAAGAAKIDYSAYRRQYRAHQHTMEDRIGNLRAAVRKAMAGLSPAQVRLAALDAVLDRALSPQLRRQLEQVPLMLEKTFQARHKAAAATLPDQEADLNPLPPQPHPVDAVGPTLQRVLLAELELRLQPVQGLIDALDPVADVRPALSAPGRSQARIPQRAARRVVQ